MSLYVPTHSWALQEFDSGLRQRRGSPMLNVQRLQDILFRFSLKQTCIVFPANFESRFHSVYHPKTPKPIHSHAFKPCSCSTFLYIPKPHSRSMLTANSLQEDLHCPHIRSPSSPLDTTVPTSLHSPSPPLQKISPSILPMLSLNLHRVLLSPPRRRSSA